MKCTCEHNKCPRHLDNAGNCSACIEKNLLNHELPNCFFNDANLSKDRLNDDYITFANLYLEKYGKEKN